MPNIAVVLFIIAMTALFWFLQNRDLAQRRNALVHDVQWAEQSISLRLEADREAVAELAKQLALDQLDFDAFQNQATRHMLNNPDIINVYWVNDDRIIRWAAPYETTGRLIGETLDNPDSLSAFQKAWDSSRPAFTGPYRANDDFQFEVQFPAYRGRDFLGTIVTIYSIRSILHQRAPSWFAEKYRLSILDANGRELVTRPGPQAEGPEIFHEVPLDSPLQGLYLRATSYNTDSNAPRNMLIGLAIGLSLVIVWSLHALRRHIGSRLQAERERDQLFDLSLDLLCVMRLDGTFHRVNPAFQKVLGFSPQTFLGQRLTDLAPPEEHAGIDSQLQQLRTGEPAVGFESRCRCADNSYRWFLWTASPALAEKRLYAVAHDITDRKRDEEALRTAYAFRRSMEESVLTGLRVFDLEGRVTFVNQAFCRMVGWDSDELVGLTPPMPYWPPEEMEAAGAAYRAILEGKAPRDGFEFRLRRKNGERFDALLYASPLIDGNGRQTGWITSLLDITERKRVREELEASRQRFEAVLDGLDAAVSVIDMKSGALLYVNRYFRRVFGHGPGSPWQKPVSTDDTAFADGVDLEIQHSSSGRWYHVLARAVPWVDGRSVRMEIATDISERKHAEEISRQQLLKAQLTSRLITMGEMASAIAHELNQPLSAITNYNMGCVKRLEAEDFNREDLLSVMQKSSFQAERAGQIVRRVREFVRKSEPQRTLCDINNIVEEAVGFAGIEARNRGIDIRLELAASMPPILADRILIEQVVLNLVRNGIEAMAGLPDSRRRLRVGTAQAADDMVEISVADLGEGIPQAVEDKLFSPFFTTKAEGMGMGLNICRSVIEIHEGRLWFERSQPHGTVFRFTLPCKALSDA